MLSFKKLKQAITLAKKYHKWQKRKDGTEYINHPIAVMKLLKKYNFPEDMLVAAVLHDICEDTKISSLDINKIFWTRVWFAVNALSKNKKPKNNTKLKKDYEKKIKQRKISNLENYDNLEEYKDYRFHLYLNRLYTWIMAEPWIFFIKISDQIHNLSDMTPFLKEKKIRKIREVENYFIPIYKKSKTVFDMDIKTTKQYNLFINLLLNKIKEAKTNI